MASKSPGGSRAQQCSPPFYTLPCALELCNEVHELSHAAYRLLHQLAALHDGFNNGRIAFSRRIMRALGWNSNAMLEAAYLELLTTGLIVQTRPGHGRTPRLFALAWFAVPNSDGLPFAPTEPISMPDPEKVKYGMKIARHQADGMVPAWSLATGAFSAHGMGRKINLDARTVGNLEGLSARAVGSKGAIQPTVRAEKMPLQPTVWAESARAVNRSYGVVVVQPTDTPEPDLTAVPKQGGAS